MLFRSEELGLEVDVGPLCLVREFLPHNHDAARTPFRTQCIDFVFRCHVRGERTLQLAALADPEAVEARWVALDEALTVTITGTANLAAATLPALRGTFVAVSASSATRVFPGWAAYGAAKAGLDAYIRYLAAEAGDEVTAFSFVPGLTDTAMQTGLREVDAERFPMVDQFRRWHERGVSKSPATVAEALELALALPRDEVHGGVVEADALLKAQAGR